jgi:carboxyl-terminal processing protease
MVAALGDPYTMYFTAKEAQAFNNELTGDIGGGIGAEIGVRNGQPTIIRTLPDNPAEKAGLHAGDVIVAVNDQSTVGFDADKTVQVIRGDVGTTVKITVKRASENMSFTITREKINNPSVSSELRGDIGILTVTRFDQETVGLVRKEVTAMKNKGMNKLVVDFRGNGGGYLDAAPGVAGMWLKDKLVVSVKAHNGQPQRLYSEGDVLLKGVKTAVIVNGSSASATEIVTAALKYYKVVTVVGEKTYGKGSVQELVPLANDAMLKVTIKRWYTPAGDNVNKKGITPDVSVGLTQADLDAGHDPQLEKAIGIVTQP